MEGKSKADAAKEAAANNNNKKKATTKSTAKGAGKSKTNPATLNNNNNKNNNNKKATHHGRESKIGSSGRSGTIHSVIMKEHKHDVYKKYTETEVLGNGSMGHVAKVVVKEGAAGGSAYAGSVGGAMAATKTARNAAKANAAFLTKKSSSGSVGLTSCSEINQNDDTYSSRSVTQNTCYALKSIQLDRVSAAFIDELKNEIDILKTMDHPNIVKLHEVFNHKKQIYMILELCDGGDLYTRLPYTEKDSAYITGKLLSAIKYMHAHAIVHRARK